MVKDDAFSHKIDYVSIFFGNLKFQRASESLHWFKSYSDFGEQGILPGGGAASGRVCACSLRSWLVPTPQRFENMPFMAYMSARPLAGLRHVCSRLFNND